ncbi:MAG: carboxyl transferase domain-containing protein, partial [bacterium]|nr:carboxyl transferase domain-containing protein [bacterium]
SQGRREGDLYRAVSDYAVEHGIPKLYLAESSGARIGFADEVKPYVHQDPADKSIYVLPEDLDTLTGKTQQPLRDLIRVGEQREVIVDADGRRLTDDQIRERLATVVDNPAQVLAGADLDGGLESILPHLGDSYRVEQRLPILAIIGEGEINTESLNASGMAGGSESRTRSRHRAHLPTATITFGTTIGIATYLARLSEFVIMTKNSFLGLTGYRAINDVLGTKYTDQLEVAGPDIMKENGVAYKVVDNERDALRAYLQWLSYQPVRQGEAAPRIEFHDPVDRDISGEIANLIQGAGQSYSTQALDSLIYDRGSIWYVQDDGHYGRYANTGFATLGGVPVGIISMEMSPKLRDGEKAVFPPPGGLDPDTSNKIAQHIRTVNRMGLPLIFNASITGFLPRHTDHLEGVVPAGARILDSLEEFNQPAIIWTPPQGNLYGGAWVVIDRNINPRVVMAADQSAKMGILGSTAANELPLVTRYHTGPEDIALTKAMLDATNSPIRAHAVGSIHHLIENSGETRQRLHEILTTKMSEVQEQQDAALAQAQLTEQLIGTLTMMGVNPQVEGDQITITTQAGTFTTSLERARAGLEQHFQGSALDLLRAMLAPDLDMSGD